MRASILLVLLLWKQELVISVRLVELRVPAHAAAGGEALLGCQFDMEGDVLYSVKWYKDGREFYRYVPRNRNPTFHFATPGVVVDETRSSSDVVTLINLNLKSTGVYRCEVSGEAPLFATVAEEKYVTIHVLPERSPLVTGLKDVYKFGDRVVLNCSTLPSRPEAQLKWLINKRVAPRAYLRGPWFRDSEDLPGTVETSLQLTFIATPLHFRKNVMELMCRATIAPLYQQETVHSVSCYVEQILPEGKDERAAVFPELNSDAFDVPTAGPKPLEDHAVMTATSLTMLMFVLLLRILVL